MIEKLSPEARTFLSDFLNQIDYEKDKEIERLNNIINELEEYIENNFCDKNAKVKEDISGKDIDNLLKLLEGGKDTKL